MSTDVKIVLFEDTEETQTEILAALKMHLKQDGTAIPFDGKLFTESDEDKKGMYEARIENILRKAPFDDATLLVADRDLSKTVTDGFIGLSANAVAAVATRLAIPICSYARQPDPDDYDWRGRWEEGHIVLRFSDDGNELARRAVLAARGFARIAENLPEIITVKSNNSPAKILAALLGKTEYADKIALYSVGDQKRLMEVLAKRSKQGDQPVQRLTHFLGNWLWDSLLRYPGLFVNEVAAASHLNLARDEFMKPKVRLVFEPALYHGPFEDSKSPQWWRGMLDDIVSHENCADGLELIQNKVDSKTSPSQCYLDPTKTAGYYCIIAREPVSLENSKGGLSWFPRGAHLTRISNTKYEEYAPWLGM